LRLIESTTSQSQATHHHTELSRLVCIVTHISDTGQFSRIKQREKKIVTLNC